MRHDVVMGSSGPRPPAWVRTALVVVTWVAAVALATTVAWWAVSAVGGARDGSAAGVLSRADIEVALADQRTHAASASPGTTAPPATTAPSAALTSTTPPATDPSPTSELPTSHPTGPPVTTAPSTVVVRTWDVTGGQVSVSCSGPTISLLYATPADGWTVTTGHAGPEEVEVTLRSGGTETSLKATCVGGTPQNQSSDASGRTSGGGGGGDG